MRNAKHFGLVGLLVYTLGALVNSGCAVATGAAGYYYGKDKARKEVAAEQGSGNVGGKKIYAEVERGKIRMNRWKDSNGNRIDDKGELLGDIGNSVNLSNMAVSAIVSYYSHIPISISYKVLDSSDNVVIEHVCFQQTFLIFEGALPSGDYTLVAQHGNGVHSRKFSVTR